jgi:hypothetical protein
VLWSYFTSGDKFTVTSDGVLQYTVASYKSSVSEIPIPAMTTTDVFSSPDRDSGRENYMEFVVVA